MALFLLMIPLTGCQKSEGTKEPARATVTVTVTVDGQPLPAGRILFQVNGQALGMGEIKDGQAQFSSPVGKCHVEIVGLREVPRFHEPQEYLPARYNVESKLSADVVSDGENAFTFKVTSQ
ncbi:MAG TPA: hypothetical protein VH682_29040 [Gemmataceae bacterium]